LTGYYTRRTGIARCFVDIANAAGEFPEILDEVPEGMARFPEIPPLSEICTENHLALHSV